jgi:Tfp pilus assembly protein PilF
MLGEQGERARSLGTYLGMVEEGSDPRQAFVSVFGDLEVMEKKLERYVRQTRMSALQMEAPENIDDDSFGVKVLSEATAAAVRGNFLVSGTRPDAALPLLERALALAPGDSLALESMGFYHYRKEQYEPAREWFSKATSVDSESFLCHYYLAQLLIRGRADDDQAKESLRRAIELNPDFAPAYADLASLYAATGVRLESAYGLAVRATVLEPDNAWYWINLGRILLQMEKPAEARAAAERASSVARSEALRGMVDRFQQAIESHGGRAAEVAVADAGEAAEHPLDTRSRRLAEGDRRIEGRFTELRCGEGGGSFDFVVVSDGRSFVFRTNAPGTIELIQNGERVTRDMNCGPQDARVAVIYTPSSEPSDAKVDGELRVMEFLQ